MFACLPHNVGLGRTLPLMPDELQNDLLCHGGIPPLVGAFGVFPGDATRVESHLKQHPLILFVVFVLQKAKIATTTKRVVCFICVLRCFLAAAEYTAARQVGTQQLELVQRKQVRAVSRGLPQQSCTLCVFTFRAASSPKSDCNTSRWRNLI